MARLILAGGSQRAAGVLDRDHSRLFEDARLVVLDTRDGSLESLLTYRDAPSLCAGDVSRVGHVFKGLAATSTGWLLCSQRAVIWVDREGAQERSWSSPLLNDVHHALEHDGALWVVSTGLDAVLEVRNEEVRVHAFGAAVEGERDVRCLDRRPHAVHPNHLFVQDGRLWVTCLHDRGVRCVLTGERRTVASERIHDGVLCDGVVWFTTVDGRLVGTDRQGSVVREIALVEAGGGGEPMGWCRGLAVSEGVAWVGFSRLRTTPWRHNLAWMRGAARGWQVATHRPTHVVGVDLLTGDRVCDWPVEASGLHALFGVGVRD